MVCGYAGGEVINLCNRTYSDVKLYISNFVRPERSRVEKYNRCN